LIIAFKIIRNSSLSWKDFGLNTIRAKQSIVESVVISFLVVGLLCAGKYVLMNLYPERFPHRYIMSWEHFDYTYITYLVIAPLQEFITRGVVQTSLQRLLVGRHLVLLAIMITSFLFGSLHVFSSFYLGLTATLTGWLWGWMYYRHQNLIGVSIAHFLIGNLTGLMGLWLVF